MKTKTKKLSDSPGRLILQALKDLETCENMPDKYVIDMAEWHLPYNGKCYVCLAGSVMSMSLDVDPGIFVSPAWFGGEGEWETMEKLRFLNAVRLGMLHRLDGGNAHKINMPDYHEDKPEFKKRMKWLGRRWTKKTNIGELAKEYNKRFYPVN